LTPQIGNHTKPIIGLTGGIGGGKSHVAGLFAELGAHVIDADRLGHEALRQPDLLGEVVNRWGPEVLNAAGAIDRRKLAGRVFADPAERAALEGMVFPWIFRRLQEALIRAEADPAVRAVVLDVALLLETGWDRVCDVLVFVDAPHAERLRRVQEKRGWTDADLAAREQAQWPIDKKRARADIVIDNAGDPARTRAQVERCLAEACARIPRP
jgi:dephospho-CoA kinase